MTEPTGDLAARLRQQLDDDAPRSPQLNAFLRRSAAAAPSNRVDDIDRLRAIAQGAPRQRAAGWAQCLTG